MTAQYLRPTLIPILHKGDDKMIVTVPFFFTFPLVKLQFLFLLLDIAVQARDFVKNFPTRLNLLSENCYLKRECYSFFNFMVHYLSICVWLYNGVWQ